MASSTAPEPPAASGHAIPDTAIFVTDKCYCRPYLETDAEPAAAAANDPDIAKWMRDTFPHPYTLEDSKRWIGIATTPYSSSSSKPGQEQEHEQEGPPLFLHYAIVTPDGEFAGGIGLKPRADVEARSWELGYWVGRRCRGRGVAAAAARAFAPWALAAFPGLLRIHAEVFEGNAASGAVLRRAGFREEGVLRQHAYKSGRALDVHVYGLLRRDVEDGAST